MEWISGETLKALTVSSVLLALVLILAWAWVKDRNARIEDMKQRIKDVEHYAETWRAAHEISEQAREKEREKNTAHLEQAKLTNALLSALRNAPSWAQREGDHT